MNRSAKIALLSLGTILLVGTFGFLGFAYIEENFECKFKGIFANPTEGECSSNSTFAIDIDTNYEGKLSSQINFYLPENYFLSEEEDISLIFSSNPEIAVEGAFIPNMNLIQSVEYIDFDEEICKEFVAATVEFLTPYYESLSLVERKNSGIEQLGDAKVCIAEWNSELNGAKLHQRQYAIADPTNKVVYYFTLTTNSNKDELNTLERIVRSFKLL